MKILVIAQNVGRTAPGIVFERLIDGVSKYHDVDVLTSDFSPSIPLESIKEKITLKYTKIHLRLMKLLISIFSVNPLDLIWAMKATKTLKRKGKKYDIVFSMVSFHHYIPLISGNNISRKIGSKWVVYSVDGIPAPIGWSKNDSYFRGCKRMIRRYLKDVDYIASANEQMLEYQLTSFSHKQDLIKDVIFVPLPNNCQNIDQLPNVDDEIVFLYTGGIYGARKVKYVFKAFKKLLEEYPHAKLVFVGSKISPTDLNLLDEQERMQVEVHPYTTNLIPFYERSFALIDIDADLENDIFLSSKIINYISLNRIIISETGMNSPSRKLFNNIPSIIQCNHDADEIYRGMKQTIKYKDIDFADRKKFIKLFSIGHIITNINTNFIKLGI